MNFIEKLISNADVLAEKPILADDTNPKGITYQQLDSISAKVYAYLHDKGIGKEDFVMICLPRGIQPLIAMCGVWKNGSAFVIVEDNYPPERIDFIRKDCECKAVINDDVWAEIQGCKPRKGFEKTDDHDAAYAVYTSGTTGNPKGVIHEYGNISRMIESTVMQSCEPLARPDDRFALVAPLNFVASLLIAVHGLYFGIFNYVVAYSVIKNPLLIGMFIVKNRITGTFLTPSYIRKMKSKPPMLRFCIIGSEPANEVYLEGLTIHNFYLMSESSFAVTHFLIDKKYEQTPVGKSEFGHEILLLDENGNPVPDGEEGEICFENKYVRGYRNLPEETAKAFRDGLYHSGDLARKDENGNFVICGRLSDMVKINGNRVEPGEIESVAKKVLGIDWAAARIIEKNGKIFICVYYLDKREVDFERTRKEMGSYLPYYMLPSFFIHIDSIPLRPNGKMDRKALPEPNFADYQDDYVEPTDEIETALCNAFAKVLQMERVGINDDFYQLGGDSLGAMDVLVESKLPGLSATEIFRGHTPQKIAALYRENHLNTDGISNEEINAEAMKRPHRLTAEQSYMVDYQLYTPLSTMYNIPTMLKFDREMIDPDLLAEAIRKATFAHPALLTKFYFDENGEMFQVYAPELWEDIRVEHLSELDFEIKKDMLIQPFKVFNSRLFRGGIYVTEKNAYLFMDVHHTVFDGTSSKVFFADVLKAYAGQELPVDYYYYVLNKREEMLSSEFYDESRDYFEKRYDPVKWHTRPKTDHKTRKNENDEIMYTIPESKEDLAGVQNANGLTPNSFYMTAALLTTALYNRKDRIMLSWIYNGRTDMSEMASVGLLFRNLPVGIVFKKLMTLGELYSSVTEQINKGIEHSCYPYIELTSSCVTGDLACVLYQDDMREIGNIPGIEGEVEIIHNKAASQNILDLEILNSPEANEVMFDYASSRYDAGSMERFRDLFGTVTKLLVEYQGNEDVTMKQFMLAAYKRMGQGGLFSRYRKMDWMR